MLQVRKELKMGLSIGAAVLGVAVVYGVMATLTTHRNDPAAQADGEPSLSITDNSSSNPLDNAVSGLPPKADEPAKSAPTPAPAPVAPPASVVSVDPFSEPKPDVSNSDPWDVAMRTGRLPNAVAKTEPTRDTSRALVRSEPIITETPSNASGNSLVTPIRFDEPIDATKPAPPTVSKTEKVAPEGKYIIQPGDSFASIAGKVYGNRNLYSHISKANPTVDPTKLKIGQEIALPAASDVKTERGSLAKPQEPLATIGTIDASREYRIQPGDTLSRISQKLYGKTNQWAAIYELNKSSIGADAGKLKVGTVIALPQPPSRS